MADKRSESFKAQWLFRKKHFLPSSLESTKLDRCLGLFELTALGIGATLGTGIYLITPSAIQKFAGPAMCIAFLIAGLASILSGLCYAELGARIPRAGSAYVYSYVAVGELWAFVIGWNMILEHVIASAGVARAAVTYLDVLAEGKIVGFFKTYLPVHTPFLGDYFDPLAFTICMAMAGYVIVLGFVHADFKNWNLSLKEVQEGAGVDDESYGTGGFMPYGFAGVMVATSTAFYAFVGFYSIATTGEEVTNPKRNIPLATVMSLLICAVALISASAVFSLDTPYYKLTEKNLIPEVPLGFVAVSVGAILCSTTTLLGGMFALPRIAYSMAEDGLLFAFLGKINSRFKTPVTATMLSGLITALFSGLFEVQQLVEMLSIGTLMAYSMVAASVLVLRYRESFIDTVQEPDDDQAGLVADKRQSYGTDSSSDIPISTGTIKSLVNPLANPRKPTAETSNMAVILASAISITLFITALFTMIQVESGLAVRWPLGCISIFGFISFLFLIRLWLLPQNTSFTTFQVPITPLLPVLALAVNFYMLVSLNGQTWIRFGVWMTMGFIIFCTYSIWFSKEANKGIQEEKHEETTMEDISGDVVTEKNDE